MLWEKSLFLDRHLHVIEGDCVLSPGDGVEGDYLLTLTYLSSFCHF